MIYTDTTLTQKIAILKTALDKTEALSIDENLFFERLNNLNVETAKNKAITPAQKLLRYNLITLKQCLN